MSDMEPENPGPLLKYMRSRNADRIAALTAERDRLREAGSNAAKALRLIAGMDLMSASAVAFNAARELEAALKGESHE